MASSAFVAGKFLLVSLVIVSLFNQNEGGWWWRRCKAVNCSLSRWTAWSECTRGCPEGYQHRNREVTKPASCGGSCPPKGDHYDIRNCNKCRDGRIVDGSSPYGISTTPCLCFNTSAIVYFGSCCEHGK